MKSQDYPPYVSESLERTVKAHLDSKELSNAIIKTATSIIKSIDNDGKVTDHRKWR